MGSDEIEKVAQLQFSESRKKDRAEMLGNDIRPTGRNSTSKHGEVWAQKATPHTSQGLAEGAAPTQCQQLKRNWHLPRKKIK